MRELIDVAIEAVRTSGAFVRENADGISGVAHKDDHSLVTDLDRRSEAMIRAVIRSAFPAHAVLGEEGGTDAVESDYLWVVDPLDGTHNLINGIPLVAVSVGVVHRGDFLVGAVCLPLSNDVYAGERGQGAFKNGQRICVSKKTRFSECLLAFDSGFRHFEADQYFSLAALAPHAFNARVFGCSAGNLAMLAEGRLDVVVEFDDHPWDYAGGIAILREAGGSVTDIHGAPFAFKGRSYVASNGCVHDEVLNLLSRRGVTFATMMSCAGSPVSLAASARG